MIRKILIIGWLLLLAYTLYYISNYFIESKINKNIYEELQETFAMNSESEESSGENKSIRNPFDNLIEINEDIIGWITVPGTVIDYPVVKTTNNEFYLKNNIYRQPAKAGAIFMDYRNGGLGMEYNTILYGHNMKDGTMFSELLKYKTEGFILTNPIIEFHSLYEEMSWEIFAVYVTDIGFNYLQTEFSSDEEYMKFIQNIKSKSLYEMDIEITEVDEILTLSTCSSGFRDSRLVIHARKITS